ncbi:hypothetical protein [Streptomyces sp. NPDC001657]|uniref:hypothetical protein n=1 Tax=Streptomyces sp. NPDC001657 TaxID=3154522 RepID=UPI00331861A6
MLLPHSVAKSEFIEVVRITDPARHLMSQDLDGDAVAIWDSEQAQQALSLIHDLPGGEMYRCFLPGWGIRAHSSTSTHPLFEIAFCFRCHGARIWGPDVPATLQSQTFDAGSSAASELLRRFRACIPS